MAIYISIGSPERHGHIMSAVTGPVMFTNFQIFKEFKIECFMSDLDTFTKILLVKN